MTQTPTEAEIELQAAMIFPEDKKLQENFILAAYETIYYGIRNEE